MEYAPVAPVVAVISLSIDMAIAATLENRL